MLFVCHKPLSHLHIMYGRCSVNDPNRVNQTNIAVGHAGLRGFRGLRLYHSAVYNVNASFGKFNDRTVVLDTLEWERRGKYTKQRQNDISVENVGFSYNHRIFYYLFWANAFGIFNAFTTQSFS